jgi:hypothetical protein
MLKRGGWSKLSLLYLAAVDRRRDCLDTPGPFQDNPFDAPASAADSPTAEWATVFPVARPVSAVGKSYLFTQVILIE